MSVICGIDEAGRGPLAGPVTAAAIILSDDFPREILKDSKKLTPAARSRICSMLIKDCFYSIGWAWPEEIDRINIHHATLLAMKRAYEGLPEHSGADIVLVDGLFTPDISCRREAIVKGDDRIDEIKAASIIAKNARDRWMIRYSWIERDYMFEKHKGYPTLLHRQILEKIGPCPIHRMSFKYTSS